MTFKISILLSLVGYVLMPKEYLSTTLAISQSLSHFYSFFHTHMLFSFLVLSTLSAFAEPFQIVYSGKDHDYPAHILTKHFIILCNNSKIFIFCNTIK